MSMSVPPLTKHENININGNILRPKYENIEKILLLINF